MRGILFLMLAALLATASAAPPPEPPRPQSVWLDGPMEVGVRYPPGIDREDEKAVIAGAVGKTIPYFEIEWAGDGFRPRGAPLGRLRITGARVTDGGETLMLATDPHPRRGVYVLDWLKTPREDRSRYLASGVESTPEDGPEAAPTSRSSVLPKFEVPPPEGDRPVARKGIPRRIVLRTSLLMPKGRKETLVLRGNMPFEASAGDQDIIPVADKDKDHRAEVVLTSTGSPIPLEAALVTAGLDRPPVFSARWKRGETETAIPASQLSLPWLPPSPADPQIPPPPFPLAGGDAGKGESVFTSEAAKCASCHAVGGKGGTIGPSLDDLKGRDPAEVYYHIAEPSAKILPEYVGYSVARKNGEIAVGVVRGEGFDSIRVSDIGAKTTVIPKSEIEEMRPSSASIMPVGLPGALGEANMRDLLAFLTRKD